jgi:methylglyoxal synthase
MGGALLILTIVATVQNVEPLMLNISVTRLLITESLRRPRLMRVIGPTIMKAYLRYGTVYESPMSITDANAKSAERLSEKGGPYEKDIESQ